MYVYLRGSATCPYYGSLAKKINMSYDYNAPKFPVILDSGVGEDLPAALQDVSVHVPADQGWPGFFGAEKGGIHGEDHL